MAKWLLSTKHIEFDVRDRVATITLNRPEKRNAISQTMLHEFRQALMEAGQPGVYPTEYPDSSSRCSTAYGSACRHLRLWPAR